MHWQTISLANTKAHVATIDLRENDLHIAVPPNKTLISTSSQARSHRASIAINGGFFGADGSPVGALKINGTWITKPHPNKLRGVFGFDEKHGFVFDRLRRDDEAITHDDNKFAPDDWWNEVENILGGAPLLIHSGKKIDPAPEATLSTFLADRYARTALCMMESNTIKLIVVDGGDRKTNLMTAARGMSIDELTDFLLSLRCSFALNLDGGYSSSFVAQGERVNKFTVAMSEREVSSVIVVKPKSRQTLMHKRGDSLNGLSTISLPDLVTEK